MRLTIDFKDDMIEGLEAAAKAQGKSSMKRLIEDNLSAVIAHNARENQIMLNGPQVAAISESVGGKTLRTGEDIVKLFQNMFRITVGGATIDLQPEDAQMLKDMYSGLEGVVTFNEFIRDTVLDSLSLNLWGSTRGVVAYK